MATAIRTAGLTKSFGSLTALDSLDLEVGEGEIFGYIGPNGAGKSTTIRLLLDLLRPTAGSAEILGLDVRRGGLEVRAQVGYLAGELALYEELTARELLKHLARLRGGVEWSHVEQLAERFGLDLERPIRDLSKGNKQKVGLTQAFMHRPRVMILDEPTSGLDPLLQRTFHELCSEARSDGTTILLSSHVLSELEHVADRVAMIRGGRLLAVEQIAELKRTAPRRVVVTFAAEVAPQSFESLPGVAEVEARGKVISFTTHGGIDAVVKAVAAHEVLSLTVQEEDLEQLFIDRFIEDGQENEVEAPMGELVFQGLRAERRALLGWSLATIALVGSVLAFWPSFGGDSGIAQSFKDLPPSVQAATGISDLGTAEGYLQGQLFSTVVPLLFLSFGIGRGARAIAGEEDAGTMDLLLAMPIRRSRVVLEKALLIGLELLQLALVLWLALLVFSPLFDLGVSAGRLLDATVAGVALGFLYGGIALACGAGLGRRGLSLGIAAGLAAAGFIYTSIAPYVSALADNVGLSPFQHAYGYDPLKNGLQFGDLVLLLGGAAVFTALAVVLFDRRDVR